MINRRDFLKSAPVAAISLAAGAPRFRAFAQDASTFVIGSLEEPGSLSALTNLPHHFPADVPGTLLFDSLTQYMPDASIGPKLATAWDINRHLQAQFFNSDSDYGAQVMVVQYDHTVVQYLDAVGVPYLRQERVMPTPFRHSGHTH